MAKNVRRLKQRARKARVPVIYVNDNFGKWRSDFRQQLGHVLEEGVRGEEVAELLRPDEEDYFVLKAKHSGFYHTQLDLLLEYLDVKTVVLTGFTTDICVLFTAADAYMRDLHIVIPEDCSAAPSVEDHEHALEHMERVLDAQIVMAEDVSFEALLAEAEENEEEKSGAK